MVKMLDLKLLLPHPMRLFLILMLLTCSQAQAWSGTGHRYSAEIAYNFLSEQTREKIFQLLAQHPRYQDDFLAAMPTAIASGTEVQRQQWLLTRAANWPDIARGLPDAERQKFNRPQWHFIDGAWLRDSATLQGNYYVGVSVLPDISGVAASAVTTESQAANIILALDFNARQLREQRSAAEQAVALCWILHLIADLHQPLHTGSLYSARLFKDGDAGGNRFATNSGNLHARWDGALNNENFPRTLGQLLTSITPEYVARLNAEAADWSAWMRESREILRGDAVYDQNMIALLSRADNGRGDLAPVMLNAAYIASMQEVSRQRLAAAGMRLALWLNQNLQ